MFIQFAVDELGKSASARVQGLAELLRKGTFLEYHATVSQPFYKFLFWASFIFCFIMCYNLSKPLIFPVTLGAVDCRVALGEIHTNTWENEGCVITTTGNVSCQLIKKEKVVCLTSVLTHCQDKHVADVGRSWFNVCWWNFDVTALGGCGIVW